MVHVNRTYRGTLCYSNCGIHGYYDNPWMKTIIVYASIRIQQAINRPPSYFDFFNAGIDLSSPDPLLWLDS